MQHPFSQSAGTSTEKFDCCILYCTVVKEEGYGDEMVELACREMVEWVGAMMFSLLLFLSAGFLQALTAESIFPKVCLTNRTFLHT
jgi:E3 ubiquitin-protein ligase DOA10